MDPLQISQEIEKEVLNAEGVATPNVNCPVQYFQPQYPQMQYYQPVVPYFPVNYQYQPQQVIEQKKSSNILFGFVVPLIFLVLIFVASMYSKKYIANASIAQITKADIVNNDTQKPPEEVFTQIKESPALIDSVTPSVSKVPR